jgi:hypothetical protein
MMSTVAELDFKLWCAAAATRRQSHRLFSMSCGRTLLARALAPDHQDHQDHQDQEDSQKSEDSQQTRA